MEINYKLNICKKIDEWLNEHKEISCASFARELGLTDSSVFRWRAGTCAPDTSLLPKICEIMNISLSELFGLPSNNSLPEEEKLLQSYRTNPEFKEFIDKYLNDNEFKQVINSRAKISK